MTSARSGPRGKTGKMKENSILELIQNRHIYATINTFNIFTLQGKSPIGNIFQFVLTLLNIY